MSLYHLPALLLLPVNDILCIPLPEPLLPQRSHEPVLPCMAGGIYHPVKDNQMPYPYLQFLHLRYFLRHPLIQIQAALYSAFPSKLFPVYFQSICLRLIQRLPRLFYSSPWSYKLQMAIPYRFHCSNLMYLSALLSIPCFPCTAALLPVCSLQNE